VEFPAAPDDGGESMRTAGRVIGVLMVLGGGVWILQGINILPGSFMTGDPRWAVRGLVMAVLGVILFVVASRRRSEPTDPA
jgi:hypothetical protein